MALLIRSRAARRLIYGTDGFGIADCLVSNAVNLVSDDGMLFFRFPESEQQAEAAAKQAEEIEAIVARAASFLANSPTPESS